MRKRKQDKNGGRLECFSPLGSKILSSQHAPRPSGLTLAALMGAMLLCWSANYTFGKVALREIPSVMVACFRTVLSGLLIWPIYFAARKRGEAGARRWRVRDVPRLLAVGVLALVGNQVIFVIALNKTSVAHSALISAMSPMFVLLGAVAAGQERLTGRKLGGMALAIAGVIALQFGHAGRGQPSLNGDLLMILATSLFATFSVFGKRLAGELGTVTLNTFAFVGGGFLLLPVTLWGLFHYDFTRVSLTAWGGVLYMSIFPSIVGYLIFSYALRFLPASRVASVSYLQPVLATLLAMAFLGERPGIGFVGGAVLVLAGVWFAEVADSRRRPWQNGPPALEVQELPEAKEECS